MLSTSTREWLESFLNQRQLDKPDGRALYAYRCTQHEFAEILVYLRDVSPNSRRTSWVMRAFVLYAAEWWQRNYNGGPWTWKSLLREVEWRTIHFPDLYDPVREALSWWKVELVRLQHSRRYIGTFACQGGLPLAFLGESSQVTSYLRAVLRHVVRYRQFFDDSIVLARDQEHMLRPPTLRREYVFRLAADLVDAVLNLRDHIKGEDVLTELDKKCIGWRESMPLALDNDRARQLLLSLFRESTTITPIGGVFRVERFLSQTSVGWRLGARIHMPRKLHRDDMAKYLGVSVSDLSSRMHVRTIGQSYRVVGLYAEGNDEYHLVTDERNNATTFWDEDAIREFRIECFAQHVIGTLNVRQGGALKDLPWVFRQEEGECPFISEASVSDRAPVLLVALFEKWKPSTGRMLDETVVARQLWKCTEPTVIETETGSCSVKPSSKQMLETEYHLSGDRFNGFDSNFALYRGKPRLLLATTEKRPQMVPTSEVSWRNNGKGWQQEPDGFGLWEVRHMKNGELLNLDRVGLFPESFQLTIRSGSDQSRGELLLENTEGAVVADHGSNSQVTISSVLNGVRIQVEAENLTQIPTELLLSVHWVGARELNVRAPFPIECGWFLKNERLLEHTLAIHDTYGVRATAFSTNEHQQFWLEGELRAPAIETLNRVVYVRKQLRRSGMRHELALFELSSLLKILLGASASSDAKVVLRITNRSQTTYGQVDIKRFSSSLKQEVCLGSTLVKIPLSEDSISALEAVPLARAVENPVVLPTVKSTNSSWLAILPETLRLDQEPWVVAVPQDDRALVEPVVVGGRSLSDHPIQDRLSLQDALRLSDSAGRAEKVKSALFDMVDADNSVQLEEQWELLTELLLSLEGLPSTVGDLVTTLSLFPRLLVRSLFWMEENIRRRLWRLDEELPFSWLLICRKTWREEVLSAHKTLFADLGRTETADRLARERVLSVLNEGVAKARALETVKSDIELALNGEELREVHEIAAREERDRKTQNHVNMCVRLDDWPTGDGRREWENELERGEMLSQLRMWQSEPVHRKRQPTFDTPVAAAWCCFFSKPTERTLFLVKRMRAHNPQWFDLAYKAAWFKLARTEDRLSKNYT